MNPIKKKQFRNYEEKLIHDLQDEELASVYLDAAFIDEDPRIFLLALKNVCQANSIKTIMILKNSFYS